MELVKLLNLELAGGCNYSCSMCTQSTGRGKDFNKVMSLDFVKKVVDDAVANGAESVTLHGGGEPTLNKNLIEIIKYIKTCGVNCSMFSNGKLISKSLADQLAESGIDLIRISATGYDRGLYQIWMSEDSFDTVKENTRYLMSVVDNVHSNHLIINSNNIEHEVSMYRKNWIDELNIPAEIWLMHNFAGQREYKRDPTKRRSCGRPFHPTLEVRAGGADGRRGAVVPCCLVLGNDEEATLGYLDSNTIEDVINGQLYKELRMAHTEERFDDIPYCKGCDQLYETESLVWTNIPDRKQYQLKAMVGLDDEYLR